MSISIPDDEPQQIVCTGEAGSNVWSPAFGYWEADEFDLDSNQEVGQGERLYVNRRLYDAQAAEIERLTRTARWNATEDGGIVRVCRDEHDKGEACEAHEEVFAPLARATAAEAEVEKLRAALKIYAEGGCDGVDNQLCSYEAHSCCRTARLALAERKLVKEQP